MCVSFFGISQTQCNGITKQNEPCKRKTKDISGKCHNHRENK